MAYAGLEKEELEKAVLEILKEAKASETELTLKAVRRKLEEKLELEDGVMNEHKAVLKGIVEVCIEQLHSPDDDDNDSDDSDDSAGGGGGAGAAASPEAKTKAPAKRKRKDEDESEPKKAKMTVKTVSGSEAPKGVKAAQQKAIKGSKFLSTAPNLTLNVFGNELEGEAREFKSGKYGWYVGGKIEVNVNGKVLWGQVGCNLVMIGSEGW